LKQRISIDFKILLLPVFEQYKKPEVSIANPYGPFKEASLILSEANIVPEPEASNFRILSLPFAQYKYPKVSNTKPTG
jgi:hypothetical protein